MISIAIDGPAGAGKSSIAKQLALQLGFIYIDTGAIYRAYALYIINNNIDPSDNENVSKNIKNAIIEIDYFDGTQRTFLNKVDVSNKIRSSSVSMATSQIARNPDVRTELIKLQRGLAKNNNVIMDGRDIGTVVLKDAHVKIYLTASPKERANRRVLQLKKQGIHEEFDNVYNEILERDYNDINKSGALRQADDAIVVDNTNNTKEETIKAILDIIKDKTNG